MDGDRDSFWFFGALDCISVLHLVFIFCLLMYLFFMGCIC